MAYVAFSWCKGGVSPLFGGVFVIVGHCFVQCFLSLYGCPPPEGYFSREVYHLVPQASDPSTKDIFLRYYCICAINFFVSSIDILSTELIVSIEKFILSKFATTSRSLSIFPSSFPEAYKSAMLLRALSLASA